MQVLLYQAVTSTPSEYFMLCSSLCRPPFFLSCLFKMYRISFHSPNYENESGSQNAKQTQQHKMGKNELNSCDSKTWNLGVFENQIKFFFSARQKWGNSIILWLSWWKKIYVICHSELLKLILWCPVAVDWFLWKIPQKTRTTPNGFPSRMNHLSKFQTFFCKQFRKYPSSNIQNKLKISMSFLGQAAICCGHFHVIESQLYSISSKQILDVKHNCQCSFYVFVQKL